MRRQKREAGNSSPGTTGIIINHSSGDAVMSMYSPNAGETFNEDKAVRIVPKDALLHSAKRFVDSTFKSCSNVIFVP
jgi:hypothetical protein